MIEPSNNRLRELREDTGLSRRDLAIALDVTEETIRRFEDNRGGPIPSRYIPTLVGLLKTETDYLMGWGRDDTRAAA